MHEGSSVKCQSIHVKEAVLSVESVNDKEAVCYVRVFM